LAETQSIWSEMFKLDGISPWSKILRPVIVYLFLVVGVRMAGKRQLAQLNPFDLVVLLTLANTVQNAIIGNDNSVTGGLIGATALLIINYLVVRFLYGHQKLEHLIEGDPDVLIAKGKIRHDRLKHELITVAELEAACRRQGFTSLAAVDRAILEPGGTISFCAHPSAGRNAARRTVRQTRRPAGRNPRAGGAAAIENQSGVSKPESERIYHGDTAARSQAKAEFGRGKEECLDSWPFRRGEAASAIRPDRLQIIDCRLQIEDGRLQIAERRSRRELYRQ
jgi:uncharacterized membrane protein YcaP (DUF421 family)